MRDSGYSAIIDAVIFLLLVSACVLILSTAISGGERQRAAADAGLRSLAASTLTSMETVKLDLFEYRIAGDYADAMADKCGINSGAWLYRDVTKAVLGRGNRHKTMMEVAAEAAACQFSIRYGNDTLRLNPLTGDYSARAGKTVESFLDDRLESRYGHCFSLRWVPFAGVPFEGSVSCGDSPPPGAASISTLVTMPYRTGYTEDSIEEASGPELVEVENASRDYRATGAREVFKERVRASLGACLEKTSRLMVREVLGNTLYEVIPANDAGNPLAMLATFSDNDSTSADPLMVNTSFDLEGALCRMVVLYNAGALDQLTEELALGVDDGTLKQGDERAVILRWMGSLYCPSSAHATLSVWVRADD
jgi:hypothetical protein